MNIELTEREIMFLKQYARVYEEERNLDSTNDPIVVVEDVEEFVAAEGFGEKTVYLWKEETYYSLDELEKELQYEGFSKYEIEAFCDDLDFYGECNNKEIQKYEITIRYRPIAYFLTRAEADRYVEYQGHNLIKPRVYTRYCGYSNKGDLQCLYKLLLKMGRQLCEVVSNKS